LTGTPKTDRRPLGLLIQRTRHTCFHGTRKNGVHPDTRPRNIQCRNPR
jgi:hypothetical protein